MARLLYLFTFFFASFLLSLKCAGASTSDDGSCTSSGSFLGSGGSSCDECCKAGESYPTYDCSPPVSGSTPALLTLNSFEEGGDGGGPSKCDDSFHSNSESIVALSTGWYSGGSRCGKTITITGNGRSTTAKVVDECDSTTGCDEEHAHQPPCRFNIVDGSPAVWEALGVAAGGEMGITWSDT